MIGELARIRADRETLEAQRERVEKRTAFLSKWAWRLFILAPMLLLAFAAFYGIGYESGYLHGALHRVCIR